MAFDDPLDPPSLVADVFMHTIARLYTDEFDFPRWEGLPRKTYMLATIPRSGSTYVAISLWRTGQLGTPMEYLNFPIMGRLFKRLGFKKPTAALTQPEILKYWQMVVERRTSPNGLFGYKMFMKNFTDIGKGYPNLLDKLQPDFTIYLTRDDILDQAISYSRAIRSKTWFSNMRAEAQHLDYDANHISYCIDLIRQQKTFWEDLFRMTNVQPYRVSYEQILLSKRKTFKAISSFLNIDVGRNLRGDVPLIEKQNDAFNRVWRERFLSERPGFDVALYR